MPGRWKQQSNRQRRAPFGRPWMRSQRTGADPVAGVISRPSAPRAGGGSTPAIREDKVARDGCGSTCGGIIPSRLNWSDRPHATAIYRIETRKFPRLSSRQKRRDRIRRGMHKTISIVSENLAFL